MLQTRRGLYYTYPRIGYAYNPKSDCVLYLPLWHPSSLNYGIQLNGTGLADNAPVNLVVGEQTITASQAGTFTVHLQKGYTGTVASGTAVITGSPVSITGGGQSVTAEGTGTFTVTLSNVIVSKDLNEHLATVTGATHGVQGRTFDGTDDKIDLGTADILEPGTGQLATVVWLKTSYSGAEQVVLFEETASGHQFKLSILATGEARLTTYDGAAVATGTGTSVINNGNWYFVVYNWLSGSAEIYVDTVKEALTLTGTYPTNLTPNQKDIGIRSSDGSLPFNGTIGECMIYSRALTLSEILRHYQATKWRYK